MVWKAKTSVLELIRRRRQTLLEWMSQMGLASVEDVLAWCATNDAVLDVPLSAIPKNAANKSEEDAKPSKVVEKTMSKKADAPSSDVNADVVQKATAKEDASAKVAKVQKNEGDAPPAGTK